MIIVKTVRFLFFNLFPALLVLTTATGQVKFTSIASSREIGRGDYVQVEFVVENAKEIEHLTPPSFQGFHIVQGPVQSSGMSIVNGNMSQYKAISFVLQPTKTGKFTIAGASAVIDGKPMRSNTIIIEVNTAAGGNANHNNPLLQPVWPDEREEVDREFVLKPGENMTDKIRKNLFVKVEVDKTSCYAGESFVATYKLYSRLRSESRVTKRPSLNGFSVYDMVDPNTDQSSVETVNGKPFTVHIIRKTQLVPLQAGIIELDPVEVENMVHFIRSTSHQHDQGNSLQDLFDRFQGEDVTGTPIDENVTLTSKPVAINVKSLPVEGKPVNYNGAVGHFSMQASIINKKIVAQDPATLKIIVKGNGNLPVINAPAVSWPAGIETYDAKAREDVDKTVAPMSGTKTFEYVFIPKAPGNYNIPAVEFSYFDPSNHLYKTIQSQALSFEVRAATKKKAATQPVVSSGGPNEETGGRLTNFIQEHLEWFFAIIIFAGLAIYLWRQNIRFKQFEQKSQPITEVVKVEGRTPAMITLWTDPLLGAKSLLERSDYRGFYSEVNRAVWNTVANKLDLTASELNKYNITSRLRVKGWDEENVGLLASILNECEMNLYTPDTDMQNMQHILQNAERVIRLLNEA